MSSYPARVDDRPVELRVEADALFVGTRPVAHVDVDVVDVDGYSLTLTVYGGDPIVLTHLAKARDQLLAEYLEARGRARRAALLQWTGDAPIDTYDASSGDTDVSVSLFADGITVESPKTTPTFAPLSLIESVERNGYAITLTPRVLPPVTIAKLGPRTDEFLMDLEQARAELGEATASAYTALAPDLAGYSAPDGWPVAAPEAGRFWAPLRSAVAGQSRAAEVDTLERLSEGALRLGIKRQKDGDPMSFALAQVGKRVAVEATDTDDRATFVFETDDVDRLAVALLLTSFRREALSLPDGKLGRWALAARTLDVVRWARSAFVTRVVHDEKWADNIRAVLPAD